MNDLLLNLLITDYYAQFQELMDSYQNGTFWDSVKVCLSNKEFNNLKNIDCSEDCAICMENRENDKFCQLNCQHYFCVVCVQIILHLPRAFHCPLCREKVDTIKVMNSAYINP